MPAFELVDSGEPVPMRGLLPAVILLTDLRLPDRGGQHDRRRTARGHRDRHQPRPRRTRVAPALRALDDPADGLRAFLRLPPRAGVISTLLVDRSGTVRKMLPELRSPADFEPELARLAS